MMKTLQEALTAFNAREANENTIQGMLAEIAVLVLSGGYFLVNEDTRIYPMDIEFYLYGEKESDKKIPWIRDTNMYHKGKGVPYFPVVGTFYPHESGVDVTFENEKEEYRASFLIRQYKYEEGGKTVEKPRYLWEDLFGYESFFAEQGLRIKWVDGPEDIDVTIETDVRFNLNDPYKKPWRFFRVN